MKKFEFNPHEYLHSFVNFELQLHQAEGKDFDLSRIHKLLDMVGPHVRDLRVVHVAGTKGKGSTCAFLASILQQAGYKVGLYTSPHLHRLNERIRILNKDNLAASDPFAGSISDEDLADVLAQLRSAASVIQEGGSILTFFEVLTVAALVFFFKSKVDVVILETGLGGRLDATNAVFSQVAVVTPLSLDHTRILGGSLSQIAFEKAGIIKNTRQRVVLAPQEKEAMDVLIKRCREFGINPVIVPSNKFNHLQMALKGRHQEVNAAVALAVAEELKKEGFAIDQRAIVNGLKTLRWPGRFELLARGPDIVVDCAHNAASAQALAATLMEVYPCRRVLLVLGASKDKDIGSIAKHLKDIAAHIFLTKASHPRAHVFSQEEAFLYFSGKPFEITASLKAAMEAALRMAKPDDVILVTGSFFIVAEAMDWAVHLCTNTKD